MEKKVDELLSNSRHLATKAGAMTSLGQLDNLNQVCPLCQRPVIYQPVTLTVPEKPEITMEVIVRLCGCEPKTPLLPIQGDLP